MNLTEAFDAEWKLRFEKVELLFKAMLERKQCSITPEFLNDYESDCEDITVNNFIIQSINLDGDVDLYDNENFNLVYDVKPNHIVINV